MNNLVTHITDENSTKHEFASKVRKWTVADTQLKLLNDKTKQIREIKHQLTADICRYIQDHNIRQTIEISDGELRIYEKKEYPPLTYTYLEECLDKLIPVKDHVTHILEFIKENRTVETCMDIKKITRKS